MMTQFTRVHSQTALLLFVFVLAACSGGGDPSGPPGATTVDAVTVNASGSTMNLDEERTFIATTIAGGQAVTGHAVTWSTSAANIATVSQQGVVRAHRAGSVRITATSEGKSGSADITVQNPVPIVASVAPSTIAAGNPAPVITVDGTGFASDAVVRVNGEARPTTFISRNRLTAQLTAAEISVPGNVPVTVTNPAPGGGASQAVSIAVGPPAVSSVDVTPATAQLVPGQTQQLNVLTRDATGAVLNGRTVMWTSNVPGVASVSQTTGLVTAVAPGSATITATSEGKTDDASITVVPGALIGSAGGTASSGTVAVEIPPGAVAALTPISIQPEPNPPAHARLVTGSAVRLGPDGTTFTQPATVRLSWTASQEPGGSNPSSYAVHRWNGISWVLLSDAVTNAAQRNASGRTSTFSIFALIELVSNPLPVLASITPSTVTAGSPATLITATGSGFTTSSQILVNGNAVTTTFVSTTQLTAQVSAAVLASAGSVTIRVRTPAPGGGDSEPRTLTVQPPAGTTITVNTTLVAPANQSQCTLRDAVQAANINSAVAGCPAGSAALADVIVLPAGTYSVVNTLVFSDPTGVTVRGVSPAATIIDGNNAVGIMSSTDGAWTLRVESLTMRNGFTGSGGAIRTRSALWVENVHFLDNNATAEGGAIDASVFQDPRPPVTIINSVFTNNQADEGGALEGRVSFTISGSTFSGNVAREQQGGAIQMGDAMPLTITNSDFVNNVSQSMEGGAIARYGGVTTISNSNFIGNKSMAEDGGALYFSNGTLNISGSTFSGNNAFRFGGAISIDNGALTLMNSTMYGNSAGSGGAIYTKAPTTTLQHVTIADNTGQFAIYPNSDQVELIVGNSILTNNMFGSCRFLGMRTSRGGNVADASCGLVHGSDKVTEQVFLGSAQLNGGRTMTRMPAANSPAIDAGVAQQCLTMDQRGVARPQGPQCDAGAVEVQVSGSVNRNGDSQRVRRSTAPPPV